MRPARVRETTLRFPFTSHVEALSMCRDEAELVREVRITVFHEFAHHFGIDDDHLHELGWG